MDIKHKQKKVKTANSGKRMEQVNQYMYLESINDDT